MKNQDDHKAPFQEESDRLQHSSGKEKSTFADCQIKIHESWTSFRAAFKSFLLIEFNGMTCYEWVQLFALILIVFAFFAPCGLSLGRYYLPFEYTSTLIVVFIGNLVAGTAIMMLSKWGLNDAELERRLDGLSDDDVETDLSSISRGGNTSGDTIDSLKLWINWRSWLILFTGCLLAAGTRKLIPLEIAPWCTLSANWATTVILLSSVVLTRYCEYSSRS